MFRSRLSIALVSLVMVLGLGACQKAPVEKTEPPVVWVVHPQQDQGTSRVWLAGQVVAPQQSALGFQVPGRVAERRVEVGTRVHRGQVLMVLDDRDYRLKVDNLEAQMAAIQSDLETAQRDLRRLEDLLRRKLVSQQQVDNARNLVTKLAAQLNALKPQLDQARNQLTYTRLKAPFDGVVTARQVEVGQVVGVGTSVLTMAGAQRAAVFDWPETLGRPPQKAQVSLDGRMLVATLDYISPQADPVSRTFVVRYRLNLSNVPLGRSVTLQVSRAEAPLWRLPSTAVRMEKEQALIYQVISGRVKPIAVKVVRMDDAYVWVRAALRSDMQVVRTGVHTLVPEQAVRVREDG